MKSTKTAKKKKHVHDPYFPLVCFLLSIVVLLVFGSWVSRKLQLQDLAMAAQQQGQGQNNAGAAGGVMLAAYQNSEYGLSFSYPNFWSTSGKDLSASNTHFSLGNPLSGTQTYQVAISVLSNPQALSAQDFVKNMLTQDAAQDAVNTANGPAPTVTPRFDSQYPVVLNGSTTAYELYNVFEFDHNAEQLYIQQNKQMIVFDFPTGDNNPNIANAAVNNTTAHQILETVALDPAIWKFCGGIAAFQCPAGYSCKLDGTYPDAGGHCTQ